MQIQVVLTENDPKLGKRGEIIKVSSGFAQNFLFPHNKAKPATPANLIPFDREKIRVLKEEAERLTQARQIAERIASITLKLDVSVGEADKLFGSVTTQDIVDALMRQNIFLDKKKIHLEEPIKRLGHYQIPIKLHPDVVVELNVELRKKS